jgi:hypothetical protein
MRKTVVAFALICVAACALAQDSALKIGSIVAARWDDGSWYRGKVTAIKSGIYTVDYDDGDSSTLQRSEIKLISANPKVAKGQKVFAPWEEDGIFYLGTVSEVRKTGIVIAWDDGGQSASIPFGMFTTDVAGLAGQAVAAAASSAAKSFALWYKGSRVGEVEPTGRVWIGGSAVGEIEPDGRVWKGGSLVGEIEADGRIWEDGAQVGEIESNGRVWKNGSQVGEIESNGRVWKDGSIVGEAPGLKLPWTAAIYFFFFIDE